MANLVEIYTTQNCAFCKMAKQYFKENNIEYKEYDVSVDKERAQEMIEKTHQYGVPVIVINGKVVVGFDREKVSQFLGM